MIFKKIKTKIIMKLKKIAENLPEPISKLLVYIPFSWRLGKSYTKSQTEINKFNLLKTESQKEIIYKKTKKIVTYAFKKNKFYHELYDKNNFDIDKLRSFQDIKHIPIVTKSDLQKYALEERSNMQHGRIKINSGGTSGKPLVFYVDNNAFAREWAHMHTIWDKLDYKKTDLKLTFRGKNLGKRSIKYNAVHNEYIVNTYKSLDKIKNDLFKILSKKNIKYIHGYPSEIYNFANFCLKNKNLTEKLKENLKGIFFGSEYPAPIYRDLIEEVFEVSTISWYGHSEMAILAYEKNDKYIYEPMHTYGYCESVKDENGKAHLVGTSYHNNASPFIRYDTEDIIEPVLEDNGILKKFKIETGRIGNFIYDKYENKISLTALIFGRHHKIFEYVKFVQVYQDKPGKATIIISLDKKQGFNKGKIKEDMDLSNVDIEFNIILREDPIKTESGKVPLRIYNI